MENEVDTMIKILNNIGESNKLSLDNELLLGQTFSSIENRATSEKNSLILVKLNTFFKHIEWDLSDIKNYKYPNWETKVYPIIKKIQEFMESFKVLKKIEEVEEKIEIVNRKIEALPDLILS